MSDKKTKKPRKAAAAAPTGTPAVRDNTNDTFDLVLEKNKEFDFGDDDEPDDPTADKPARAGRFSIQLREAGAPPNMTRSVTRPASFALPPSRRRSVVNRVELERAFEQLEAGDYASATTTLAEFAATTTPQYATLSLAYILACTVLARLETTDDDSAAYLAAVLLELPLLAPHRRVAVSVARSVFETHRVALPPALATYFGLPSDGPALSGACWACGGATNRLAARCGCGATRLYDCATLEPLAGPPRRCVRCGAVYAEQGRCAWCRGLCEEVELSRA